MNYRLVPGLVILLLSVHISTFAAHHEGQSPSEPLNVDKNWRDPKLKNLTIPSPEIEGESYEATVPDTLDLNDPAVLSIHGMTSMLNPEFGYTQYTSVDFRAIPPFMWMGDGGLTNLNPKWMEALPLLRIMSGSTLNQEMDGHLAESLVHITGRDGLSYQPPEYPGAFYDPFTKGRAVPAADMLGTGRELIALSIWDQVTGNPLYRELAERKIARLFELVADKGDTLYFRRSRGYYPGEEDADKVDLIAITDHEMNDPSVGIVGTGAAHTVGSAAMGAARYYMTTGYKPALELSRGLALYLKDHAKLIDDEGKWHGWHFHIVATYGLLPVLEYAVAVNDRELLEWNRRAYEYGRSIGEPLLGWYAGVPPAYPADFNPNSDEIGKDNDRDFSEPCSIAGMIMIALRLTQAGMGDYYEDVEYATRNMLVETQVTSTEFKKTYPKELSDKFKPMENLMKEDPRMFSFDDVMNKGLGSFVNSTCNQWNLFGSPGPQACACCIGNAGRILYYVWDRILQDDGKDLRVNMLLNRASPWADLDSYLPYEGKVVLKMKRKRNVWFRIPSWTDKDMVSCTVNGKPKKFRWEGNYIYLKKLKPGQELRVEFPISERTIYRNLKGKEYFFTLKGFTVIDMHPRAEVTPLFVRDHYKMNETPMRNVKRFVADQNIIW